jgi:multidrug efflux pump subunit AcrA (membrane-fusion protein)
MTAPKAPIPLFRREAVDHQRSKGLRAELLAIDSAATSWGFRLLCAAMAMAFLFFVLGRLNEYASGPAFVRLDGSTTITASAAGLVTKVLVTPGDKVQKGDVLVRFHATEELGELDTTTRELETEVERLLLHPDDPVTRAAIVSLRGKRDLAQQRLDQRTVRAPHSGTIGDVRVREGQLVDPGLRMLDLQGVASTATVVALLPGRYRPMLRAGDKLRFELDGFHHRAHELVVSHVGDQIVGPSEAARYLGRDLADAFSISSPVILVQATLDRPSFELDGQRYDFASGMYGKAEAVVRNEPIAFAFVPSLKPWADQVRPLEWARRLQHWMFHVG